MDVTMATMSVVLRPLWPCEPPPAAVLPLPDALGLLEPESVADGGLTGKLPVGVVLGAVVGDVLLEFDELESELDWMILRK
jgi:hypothetical protein